MSVSALRIAVPLTTEDVCAMIGAYVSRGEVPMLAAERVIRDLSREGRQDDLLALIGAPALFDLWHDATRTKASTAQIAQRKRAGANGGNRRRELDALRNAGSHLESMFEINGRWKRLGDLTRADCLKAAGSDKRAALKIAQRSRWLHAIAQTLGDGEHVRDKHSEDSLARLLAEAGGSR